MGKSDLRVFIGADIQNFNKNIKAAQQQLSRFEGVAKNVGSSIKNVLVGAFAIDSAQRFFSTMVEYGRGFEDQMAKVQAVSNATTKEFQMMREEAARLGSTTRYSASEAARALENLTRNGLSATKATKALANVLQLAGANAIELGEAADIVTNTMNMFELSVEELNRVNDVLSKTTASSATNITDLYEALKYGAPTANLFGISIEEVNAALGVLANNGIKGSQAGTVLRNVLNSLVKPSRQAKDILANLGIDEVTIKMDGLLGTLQKFEGLNISDFVKVFGKEFGGITKALVNNGDLTSALKGELENSAGTAARMFEQGAGSFNKAVDNFKSAFEGAMIKAFDAIKPALSGVIKGFTDLIGVLSDVPTVASAAIAALLGIGTKGALKLRKEAIATNEEIYKSSKILEQFQTILNGDSDIIFRLDEDNIKSDFLECLKQIQNEVKKSGFPFDELARKIKNVKIGNIEDLYKKLVKVNELGEEINERPFNIAGLMSADAIDFLKEDLETTLKNLQREIANGNYFNFGSKEQAEKFAREYSTAIKQAFHNIDVGSITALAEALTEVEEQLSKLPKKVTVASTAFGKFKQSITNVGKSIWTFIGGWTGVLTTIATVAIPAIVNGVRKMGAAVRDARKSIEATKSENNKLNTSFKATVNELASLEKGSVAWNTRLEYLKQNYPDLTEELRLNEIFVNSSSEAYKNLADSMQKVIDKQSKINLADAAVAARDKLNETYANDDFGWLQSTVLNNVKKGLERHYKSEADKIMIQAYIQEYMSILASTVEDEVKKSKLTEVFNRMSKEFSKTKFSDNLPQILLNDYNKRVGNEIKELDKYLNHETHKGITTDDVSTYVYKALSRLNEHTANAKADAETKFIDEKGLVDTDKVNEYVANETKSFASQLLDEILNKFKGISIEGKDVRDILKANTAFTEIVKTARTKVDTDSEWTEDQQRQWEIEGIIAEQLKDLFSQKPLNTTIQKIEIEPDEEEPYEKELPSYQKGSLADIQERMATIKYHLEGVSSDEDIEYFRKQLDDLVAEERKIILKIDGVGEIENIESSLGNLSSAFSAASSAAQNFGNEALSNSLQALSSTALMAQAIAALIKTLKTCVTPWDYIAAITAGIASTVSAFASLPKFASGGIVSGNNTVGDLNLARVNAGEMILNNRQQRNLFNLLNSNGSTTASDSKVEFKIRGSELVGVLNNYNNKRSKV